MPLTPEVSALKHAVEGGCFTPSDDPRGPLTAQLVEEYVGFLGMRTPCCP